MQSLHHIPARSEESIRHGPDSLKGCQQCHDGSSLRALRIVNVAGAAVLGTTGIYLLAVYLLDWAQGLTHTNQFTLWVLLVHLVVGVLAGALFLPFGLLLLRKARSSGISQTTSLAAGMILLAAVVAMSGLALCQFEGLPRLPTATLARSLIYSLHLAAAPLACVCYALAARGKRGQSLCDQSFSPGMARGRRGTVPFYHGLLVRRYERAVRWRWGLIWATVTCGVVSVAIAYHIEHPQRWYAAGSKEGERRFEPAKTRTVDGGPIPSSAFMADDYCKKCHADTYQDWFHSVHHLSSFNNPVYRFSVRETRQVALKRDGNVRASRWCAGCHDPVPFLSGAFDDPDFDDVNDPTAHAGVTCTVCHAITHVNSTIGNGAYTIEPPQHYPFALSDNAVLGWLSDQLVKARPDFHKKSFMKPLHRTPEFCSTCHKVSLPMALNHYKEFLRGQNHYDTLLLSGASGHGARGFYYPPQAKTQCNDCHMPPKPSNDFASRDFDQSGTRKIHNHLTPGANTGVPWLVSLDPLHAHDADGLRRAAQAHAEFLRGNDPAGKDAALRIAIFGLKKGGEIDAELIAPLRPDLPTLVPGERYLVEVVIRTLNVGHQFTQGTVDSNEVWVEFVARSGARVIGSSGGLDGPDDSGHVDRWAHFVNALVLDRNGNRINRHNPQDIYTAVYDHQIPPGAAQTVHYELQVPTDLTAPVELRVRLRYRKFDHEYASYVTIQDHPEFLSLLRQVPSVPELLARNPLAVAELLRARLDTVPRLPIVDLCEDRVVLPVAGVAERVQPQGSPIKPAWQRWNDYGIGCFLEGGAGSKRGELRQAEAAFRHLLALDDKDAHAHAYTNLARVYLDEGRLSDAADVLNRARTTEPPASWWTVAWLTGMVNAQTGHLDEAIASFEQIVDPRNQPRDRKFDFTKDYVIINELAAALFKRSQQETDRMARDRFLRRAVEWYEATLQLDREDLDTHYGLSQCFARLGDVSRLSDAAAESRPPDAAELRALAQQFADTHLPRDQRIRAASRLLRAIEQYDQRPAELDQPKLQVWHDLIESCRPVFAAVSDLLSAEAPREGDLTRAAAGLLGLLYRHMHEVFRPDENARDRTVRLYRQNHPSADHAAQAIVIYPLHRAGAPGLPESHVAVTEQQP